MKNNFKEWTWVLFFSNFSLAISKQKAYYFSLFEKTVTFWAMIQST